MSGDCAEGAHTALEGCQSQGRARPWTIKRWQEEHGWALFDAIPSMHNVGALGKILLQLSSFKLRGGV